MMDCVVDHAIKEAIATWIQALKEVKEEFKDRPAEDLTKLMVTLTEEIIHCQYATEGSEPISFAAAGALLDMWPPDEDATEEDRLEFKRSSKYIKAAIAWGLINGVSTDPEQSIVAELFPDEYLRAHGIDPDKAVEETLKFIADLQAKIKAEHDAKDH